MPVTAIFGFILRSLKASFRGEKMAHLLTISTVCVSLCLVGTVYLLQSNLLAWAHMWASDVTVAIFVNPDVSTQDRGTLATTLKDKIGLEDVVWTAPDAAAVELAQILGLHGEAGLEQFTPWVAEGKRGDDTNLTHLEALSDHDLVLHVDYGTVIAERLEAISRGLRLGGMVISLLLLLGAFLVVSNTIGLALNARRDEVEIMDLVGTPLEWIYAAYLTEGILLGMAGALAAIGMIELVVLGVGNAGWLPVGFPPLQGFTTQGIITLTMVGATIGAAGSILSIRRYVPG